MQTMKDRKKVKRRDFSEASAEIVQNYKRIRARSRFVVKETKERVVKKVLLKIVLLQNS